MPGSNPGLGLELHIESEDAWDEGIYPEELPPLPPSPPENVNELWEQEELSSPSLSMTPPQTIPPPMELSNNSSDEDIKHLTETTMKGLEDFQWSVNEPSLKPLPSMMDHGESNFELPPFFNEKLEKPIEPPQFFPPPMSSVPPEETTPPPISRSLPFLSEAQIEAIVRSQIQTTLEKIAQKILPEVAERVIKQEIHRMLSE
jgi:hypothetical protein